MFTSSRVVLASFVFGLAACGSMMPERTATFSSGLEEAQSENATHATNCVQASTMADMDSEMRRHDAAFDAATGMMRDGMASMRGCSCCDTASMQPMMDGLATAESDHRMQMGSVTDVTQARSMCQAHTDDMAQRMSQMRGMADTWTMN